LVRWRERERERERQREEEREATPVRARGKKGRREWERDLNERAGVKRGGQVHSSSARAASANNTTRHASHLLLSHMSHITT
jgi:hypothetical protein